MNFTDMVALIRTEYPAFQVKSYRDNAVFNWMWTLGFRMGATTIWNTVYMDPALMGTERGADLLQHELVHIRDQHKWHILFFLSYLLCLPLGPSFKAYWEWRAYKVTLAVVWGEYAAYSPDIRDNIVASWGDFVAGQFWSVNYLWMWPFKSHVRKLVNAHIFKLKIGVASAPNPTKPAA